MGRIRDLKYRIMVPMPKTPMKLKKKGVFFEALANTLNWSMNKLIDQQEEKKLRIHIDKMYPDICDAMKNYNGVLVIARYQQWKARDEAGNNPNRLLSVVLGPAGSNQQSAYRKWLRTTKYLRGPDDGMVLGPVALIWCVRNPSFEEVKKRLEQMSSEVTP